MENDKLNDIYSSLMGGVQEESQAAAPDSLDEQDNEDIASPEITTEENTEELTVDEQVETTDETVAEEDSVDKPSEDSEESDNEPNIIDEWDDVDEGTNATDETPKGIDFGKLSNDLGIEVKSTEELKSKIDEYKRKVSEYESQSSQYQDLPQDLQKAIEFAREGGDYMEYLDVSSVNYDSIGDREILEYRYGELFENTPEGQADLQEYLDGLSDAQIRIQGQAVKKELNQKREDKIKSIKTASMEAQAKAKINVKDALGRLKSVNGFKTNPTQLARIEKAITSGELARMVFAGENGKFDYDKMVENAFKIMYGDKMLKYHQTKSSNETKRQIIDSTSNVTVKKPAKKPEATKQQVSGIDFYLQTLRGQNN